MLVRGRYKNTKDLWLYLSERRKYFLIFESRGDASPGLSWIVTPTFDIVGYFLPPLKACRLQFLQEIMQDRKKVLKTKDVPARKIPHWPQLAIKSIYPQVVERFPDILFYLPELEGKQEDRYPDRDFFYRVVNALHPEVVDNLINEAATVRMPKGQNLQEE